MRKILIAICVSCLMIFAYYVFINQRQAKALNTKIYTVKDGDCLWSIATENAPSGTDVRKYIYEIKKLNDLDNVNLQVGQKIAILED